MRKQWLLPLLTVASVAFALYALPPSHPLRTWAAGTPLGTWLGLALAAVFGVPALRNHWEAINERADKENQRLREDNASQRARVQALESQAELSKKMAFRAPYWFVEGDDVPYCPTCWEGKKVLTHLVHCEEGWGGRRWDCKLCGRVFGT